MSMLKSESLLSCKIICLFFHDTLIQISKAGFHDSFVGQNHNGKNSVQAVSKTHQHISNQAEPRKTRKQRSKLSFVVSQKSWPKCISKYSLYKSPL